MHPELLSSLAIERCRDLSAAAAASRTPRARGARRAHALTRRALVPRFRLCWTRITLAPVAGSRRGRSFVIVISATRTG